MTRQLLALCVATIAAGHAAKAAGGGLAAYFATDARRHSHQFAKNGPLPGTGVHFHALFP